MDTTDPSIVFDENGVCSHCHHYVRRAETELFDPAVSKKKLERLAAQIKRDGEGRKYDCIIGVSGGVDSTMVAYLVHQMGLRPLAVHLDNGWDAELAVHNIEHTLKVLGIDLLTHVIDWEEFRDIQLSFFRASVANIEVVTDHAIMAILFQTAAKHRIKYVISGGNVATEAIMPASWMYDYRDLRHLVSIHRRFGSLPMRSLPRCSLLRYFYYVAIRQIKYVPILNYVRYEKKEAKAFIQRELNWRDYGGKHYESIFTRFFQAYYLPVKFNMDKRLPHYSSLICSGQLTRDEALREMEKPLYDPDMLEEDYGFFLKKMRLTREEFEDIMRMPKKSYADYPSNALVFRNMPWVIRLVKRAVKPSALASNP